MKFFIVFTDISRIEIEGDLITTTSRWGEIFNNLEDAKKRQTVLVNKGRFTSPIWYWNVLKKERGEIVL